jgi:hypothetical protein
MTDAVAGPREDTISVDPLSQGCWLQAASNLRNVVHTTTTILTDQCATTTRLRGKYINVQRDAEEIRLMIDTLPHEGREFLPRSQNLLEFISWLENSAVDH